MEYMPSVLQQAISVLYSTGLGFCFGLFYDLFRIIFCLFTGSDKKFSTARDIIYILLCLFVHFIFILVMCSGRVMLFTFVGEAVGIIIYFKTLSKDLTAPIKRITLKIRKKIKSIFCFIKHYFNKFTAFIKKIIHKCKKNKKYQKKDLKKLHNLLYN